MANRRILYFLVFIAGIWGTAYGQVVTAPDLQCVENDNVNGNIILSWTNPTNNCGPFVDYTIYISSSPIGPFSVAATISTQSQTTYTDVNRLASGGTWYYYMVANYNCPGSTQQSSDTISNLSPSTPVIVNVDVTPNNTVVFNWDASTSPQTFGYVIYYYLPNGNAVPLDTVFGRNTTTYTDVSGNPDQQSLVYTISAFDSCWKISSFNTSPHNTIYATGSIVTCQTQVHLAWNSYINWPQGVKEYQVVVSKNGGPFTVVGSTDSTILFYDYENFNDGDSLCLVVRAVSAADSNVVSNSNMICMTARIVQPPSYIYMTNATVDLSNHVFITWTVDTLGQLIFYTINRSGNNVTFDPATQLNVPNPLTRFESYGDSVNVFPQNNPYYYTVTAFDSCQRQYVTPYVETVNLQGELYDYYASHLTWNDFVLQYATVKKYNLYRDYGQGYQLIHSFLPGTNEYLDTLEQFVNEKGTFCYRIEAVYDINLPAPSNYSATLSSFSNVQCIIHRPIIYIPNAFAPNGVNTVFKPTIIYGQATGYTMQIFNRWGAMIFESTDPNIGWDGTDHGKDAMMGGYAYLIQFTAADGTAVERKGMVLLVR